MRSGFSLVELSIVLVILGLLTGGILAGQSLIRAAELRSIPRDIAKYATITQTFRDKYFAIPGDMSNATKFWGSVTTSGGTCPADAGTGTQTCDGNGNGYLSGQTPANAPERYRYFQHLQNAGLLEGNLTGVAGPTPVNGNHDVIGTNIPVSRLDNLGMVVNYVVQESAPVYLYSLTTGHHLKIAKDNHPTGLAIDTPGMNAAEVWNVDTKIDDGRPDQGKFQVMRGYWSGCTTSQNAPAEYALTNTGKNCTVYAALGF